MNNQAKYRNRSSLWCNPCMGYQISKWWPRIFWWKAINCGEIPLGNITKNINTRMPMRKEKAKTQRWGGVWYKRANVNNKGVTLRMERSVMPAIAWTIPVTVSRLPCGSVGKIPAMITAIPVRMKSERGKLLEKVLRDWNAKTMKLAPSGIKPSHRTIQAYGAFDAPNSLSAWWRCE